MSILKHSTAFSILPVYARREPTSLNFLSQRITFWIALMSVFAFVTGNMFGQHGFQVFWKSVLGESAEQTIVFTGTVPPVTAVPDYERWAKLGGNVRDHTFREVPQDFLIPLPRYENLSQSVQLQRIYFVDNLGTYDTGLGNGSHTGMDIAVPVGTPIQAVANGIITKVGNDPQGFGTYIILKLPRVPDPAAPSKITNLYAIYAHLSAVTVGEGEIVNKGAIMGATGMTGFATGPHLHFQMDREDAPWHPYWAFTSGEAREAGLNMTQAVNSGLHRERGLLYTVNPMLFVQQFVSGGPRTVAVQASSSSKAPVKTTLSAIEQRRQARMGKLGVVAVTTVSYSAPEPVPAPAPVSAPVPAAASSSSSVMAIPEATLASNAAAGIVTVAGIEFRHEGSFGQERKWHTVEIRLMDAQGNDVTNPAPFKSIALRSAYGKAEFRPTELPMSSFVKGVAKVQVLPLSNSTIVLQAMPYGSLSEPIRFERDVVSR